MGGYTIDVDYRALKRELKRIADRGLKQELARANKEIAESIVAKALPNVPVRTGRLKRSLRALGNQSGAIGKAGSSSVPYAAAIHWGRKQGGVIVGRPFLREAANTVDKKVVDIYEKRIKRLFAKVSSR